MMAQGDFSAQPRVA